MKYLMLLFFCISCSSDIKQEQTTNFWDILENYNSSWDTEKVKNELGNPQEVIDQSNKKLWIYLNPNTKSQNWAIGVTTQNKISGIAYFPTSSGKSMSIIEAERRWKSRNCIHKKETKLIADNFQTIRTLECDGGKKIVEYNKYNEITGISVK